MAFIRTMFLFLAGLASFGLAGAANAQTVGHTLSFGELGAANGQLNQPIDIVWDSAGNLCVADTGNNRIQKFDAESER